MKNKFADLWLGENYCFTLTPEAYAALCHRSLSAFKRDFQKQFHSTPGKWLPEKRLQRALLLQHHGGQNRNGNRF